jgi:hypothetical protein
VLAPSWAGGGRVRRLLLMLLGVIVATATIMALWRYGARDRSVAELTVIEVHGVVRLEEGGVRRDAAGGERLDADDRLATEAGGRAVLALNGDTRVRVGPSSSVRVRSVGLDGVSLDLEDGAITATVRPESGAVRVGHRGREVLATGGEFAVGVSGEVMQVDARSGSVVLSGVDATRVEAGQQAVVIDRHAEIAPVPKELLLAVAWPDEERTRASEATVAGRTAPGARVVVRGRFGERAGRAGPDGRFNVPVPLEEGDNDVEVIAVDPLGVEARVSGQLLTRDTRGPSFQGGIEYRP